MTIIIIYMCIGIIVCVGSVASHPELMEEAEGYRRQLGLPQFIIIGLITAALWPAIVCAAIWENFKG